MIRRTMLLMAALALVAAACGDSGEETTLPTTAPVTTPAPTATDAPPATDAPAATEAPAAASTADLAITEVAFGSGLTITNLGSGDVDLSGLWLCNRPNYSPLPEQTLAAGESVQVDASALGGFSDGGGEVALYSSNSFGDSSQILDYVGWGSGGGRASVAAEAGLWPAGETVDPGGAASISAPSGGASAADWTS